MSSDSRRALIQRLIEKEKTSGNAIHRDHAFVALAEAWADYEIDMPDFRRRYRQIREDRLKHKRQVPTGPNLEAAFVSDEDFLVEIAVFSNADQKG